MEAKTPWLRVSKLQVDAPWRHWAQLDGCDWFCLSDERSMSSGEIRIRHLWNVDGLRDGQLIRLVVSDKKTEEALKTDWDPDGVSDDLDNWGTENDLEPGESYFFRLELIDGTFLPLRRDT